HGAAARSGRGLRAFRDANGSLRGEYGSLELRAMGSHVMRFQSKPIEEHPEVPLADEGQYEDLVTRWATRHCGPAEPGGENRCYVVSVGAWTDEVQRDAQLAEILGLVGAQG